MIRSFETILVSLDRSCREFYGDRLWTVAVFGSVGRGTPRADSDLDIFLCADPLPDGRLSRVREFDEVERRLGGALARAAEVGVTTRLSPVLKTPSEVRHGSALFLDMTEDARILFDRGGFFAGELAGLRQRLQRLGARRVWRGSSWFWDLKPDYKPGEVFEI